MKISDLIENFASSVLDSYSVLDEVVVSGRLIIKQLFEEHNMAYNDEEEFDLVTKAGLVKVRVKNE